MQQIKAVIDTTGVGSVIGLIFNWIPQVVGLLTMLWIIGRLYEMFTGNQVSDLYQKLKKKYKKSK